MITRFRVQNYKCLRDVTLDLTPIHVLIGPNDSGKTSVLEAMSALCRTIDHNLPEIFPCIWEGPSLIWRGMTRVPISLNLTGLWGESEFEYDLSLRFFDVERRVQVERETFSGGTLSLSDFGYEKREFTGVRASTTPEPASDDRSRAANIVAKTLAGGHMYRWVPRILALPVSATFSRRFRMEPSGFGLALLLDDILGHERERFAMLEERFIRTFKGIKSIVLKRERAFSAPVDDPRQVLMLQENEGKGVYFRFDGGHEVSASQISDGALLMLAYLAILHLPNPPRVLLIEEPENGIHPKRLEEVVNILRELVREQSHTQVILTTHSPYLVDLFDPSEVTLCVKQNDGSVAVRRLSESKEVREQMDIFTLGEIWTAKGDEALAEPVDSTEAPAA